MTVISPGSVKCSRLIRGVAAALLVGVVVAAGCGGKGGDSSSGGGPRTEKFADWNAFLASDLHRKAKRHPVVFIGLDAGVWHAIDAEIAAGRMPAFARIKREGAYGPLRSVENYVTPPAWTSMFTGYKPEKTGIYTFGYWDEAAREFISSNSNDVQVPSVWDAASRAGLKVGVFNVPMTYPPHRVNGTMVTGQMTPIEVATPGNLWPDNVKGPTLQRFFKPAPGVTDYSPPAPGMVEDSLNYFLALVHDTVDDGRSAFDTVALTVMSKGPDGEPDQVLAFETFPAGTYSPWLPFDVRRDGRVTKAWTRIKVTPVPNDFRIEISPTAFPIDATFTYPEDFAKTLNDKFGFYLPTKFMVEEVVPALTEDMAQYASFLYDYDDWDLFCFVFTQTDNIQHVAGFTEPTSEVYGTIDRLVGEIMERMPSDATLVIGSDHGAGEYEYGIDMNELLREMRLLEFDKAPRIDYDRTIVFHNLWHLYFNDSLITREELSQRGYEVPAGADPRAWLIEKLRHMNVRVADGTHMFAVEATPLPQDAVGNAPDMVVQGTYDDYMIEFWNIMNPHPQVVWKLVGSERFWHVRDGIYLVWGDGVREGFNGGVEDIENIGPTLLYLLGVPVGGDMDGHAMTELFTPGAVSKRPLFVNEAYRDLPRQEVDPDAERETLQKKLRSLGYVQ